MSKEFVYYDENAPKLTFEQEQELEMAIEDVKAGRTITYDEFKKMMTAEYGHLFD